MFQQCIIVGNLGADPEMRFTPDGTPVTDFRVAVNRSYKKADGSMQDKTWWFKVTCWRRLAETTNQYLRKGSPVMVIGEVSTSAYLSRDTNEPRASLELTAQQVKFLPKGGSSGSSGQGSSNLDDYASTDEDIPF